MECVKENHKYVRLVINQDGKNYIVRKCVYCGVYEEEYQPVYHNVSYNRKRLKWQK